jgi:glucan phosphoethanolaminetransferase (alkaline phosphatase superfamily)
MEIELYMWYTHTYMYIYIYIYVCVCVCVWCIRMCSFVYLSTYRQSGKYTSSYLCIFLFILMNINFKKIIIKEKGKMGKKSAEFDIDDQW